MNEIDPKFVYQVLLSLLGTVAVAGAIYGGIRMDLKNMHEKIKSASDNAKLANQRIDMLLLGRRITDFTTKDI